MSPMKPNLPNANQPNVGRPGNSPGGSEFGNDEQPQKPSKPGSALADDSGIPAGPALPITQKRRSFSSFMLSCGFHVALLVLVALLFTNTVPHGEVEGPRRVALVLATVTDEDRIEYEDSETKKETETTPTETDDPLPQDQPPVDPSMVQPADSAAFDSTDPIFDAGSMTRVPNRSNGKAKQYELTDAELKQLAEENAMLRAKMPKGSPTSISVFGSGNMTGRSFVFVLDRSQSMGEQGLGVLEEAASQLQAAVDSLEKDHKFQIVAYHHQTVTLEKRKLLNASADKKAKVGDFVNGLAAFGGTEHESALISALSFQPDVVVLMTDGGYPPLNESQRRAIKRITRGKTEIHCVMFGTGPLQNRDNFMASLALENRGSFKYVDVRKWDK